MILAAAASLSVVMMIIVYIVNIASIKSETNWNKKCNGISTWNDKYVEISTQYLAEKSAKICELEAELKEKRGDLEAARLISLQLERKHNTDMADIRGKFKELELEVRYKERKDYEQKESVKKEEQRRKEDKEDSASYVASAEFRAAKKTKKENYQASPAPYVFSVTNKENVQAGNQGRALGQVPIDLICNGISVLALDDDLNEILDLKVNIRDSLLQEWWVFTSTGKLGSGALAPARLFLSKKPKDLPYSKALFQNSQLEVHFQSDTKNISYFGLSLLGIRADSVSQAVRDSCLTDPRTNGPAWIYSDPMTLTSGDTKEDKRVSNSFLRIPTLPFDFSIDSISSMVTEQKGKIIKDARVELKLIDLDTKRMFSDSFISSDLLEEGSEPLNGVFFRSQSTVSVEARISAHDKSIPINTEAYFHLMFHGRRVPASEIPFGFPYNKRG